MSAEARLALAFLEAHPPRAALVLEQMGAERAAKVLRSVPPHVGARTLREMTGPYAAACVAPLPPEESAAIVAEMTSDEAAAILRALLPESRAGMLGALPEQRRDVLSRALRYPEGTAGAEMDPSVFHLPDDILVADARTRLRGAARDLLYYLYVVDRQHRLVGVLDIPELMLARTRDPISSAMHREVDRLPAWMPTSLVREHPGWHRYHAMPVVDEEQRLLGAIRYQTVRRLERELEQRGTNPALVTARALAELFHLGTTGLVSGVAATAAAGRGEGGPGDDPPAIPGADGA